MTHTQTPADFRNSIELKIQAERQAKREQKKKERQEAKELARIEAMKNQKPVNKIVISIEWKKSRMWGSNPHADATIYHKDGSISYGFAKCSGCGYDKESTVIADIFNNFLRYKLFGQLIPVERFADNGIPYGIYLDTKYPHYSGGIGANCYYDIAKAIGGKFEHTARGKSFDVFTYTEE